MDKVRLREDKQTAAEVREAETLQRAFGDDAARSYARFKAIKPEVAKRVLDHGPRRAR